MIHIEIIKPDTKDINLFSDSQSVLKAYVDDSKTIMECRRFLNEMVNTTK